MRAAGAEPLFREIPRLPTGPSPGPRQRTDPGPNGREGGATGFVFCGAGASAMSTVSTGTILVSDATSSETSSGTTPFCVAGRLMMLEGVAHATASGLFDGAGAAGSYVRNPQRLGRDGIGLRIRWSSRSQASVGVIAERVRSRELLSLRAPPHRIGIPSRPPESPPRIAGIVSSGRGDRRARARTRLRGESRRRRTR